MPCCYILYSKKLYRFYIGSTHLSLEKRVEKHLNKYYSPKSFSAKADDWKLFLTIETVDLVKALQIEKHIKKMKSKKYIINLNKYPEMLEKLILMK